MDFNVAYEKYSRLISNNPELEEEDVMYMDDFKDVDLENIHVKYFKVDKIYFFVVVAKRLTSNTNAFQLIRGPGR